MKHLAFSLSITLTMKIRRKVSFAKTTCEDV